MAENLVRVLADLKEKESLRIVEERLSAGENPMKILKDARAAMEVVGKLFEEEKYFLPELVYSGVILKEISDMVKPKLRKMVEFKRLGTVVIGTVSGDIHDIGKNMVAFMLEVNGFKVYDLGVDVPAREFVDKIDEVKPELLGFSGFLTLSYDSMKGTIDAIKEAGLRDKVKIMIGGGVIDDKIKEYTGADAYGPDAMAAVSIAKKWIRGE
ncbi:MAG: methionine synthase [Proteobacteria bacterium]|nr:methionine synthase [Pseudomonadota bacterium]